MENLRTVRQMLRVLSELVSDKVAQPSDTFFQLDY